MDSAVYSLFKVDIRDLVRNRLYIAKNGNIQPNEYADWPYYEYEFLKEDIEEYLEEEKKRNEEEEERYKSQSSINSQIKAYQSSIKQPKLPKI